MLMAAIMLAGLPSCDERVPATPREQLESHLREGVRLVGYPWPEGIIQMLDVEAAMAKSRTMPITPQQAWEAVVAYVQPIPEGDRMPSLRSVSSDSRPLPCYIWEDYYYFPARSRISKIRRPLWGCFVDSRTGEVIEYPGRDPGGHRRKSSYVQVLTCGFPISDDPEACCLLGDYYMYGKGRRIPQAPEKAFAYWLKAAEQGHAESQYELGMCYASGQGVPPSTEEAVKWLRMAAEQGSMMAVRALGELEEPCALPH